MHMAGLLDGIRVVEIATFVFMPGAGTVMSDFGADVIHVEPPGIGDPYRMLYHMKPLPQGEKNYCWDLDSRNKRSLVVNLKTDEGHEIIIDLIKDADVLITNFHPSVLSELRITYEELSEINPRLIYAHGTGFGEQGEEVEKPGYDATAWWARTGLMDSVRPDGGALAMSTAGMGDHPSSMTTFGGIALALYARERTGKGTKVSSSLLANGAWSNSILLQAALDGCTTYVPPTQSNTSNAVVNHYKCADGRSLFLVLIKEAEEFGLFCDAIERPDIKNDPRFAELNVRRENAPALAAVLSQWFAERPLAEWQKRLDDHAITFANIATTEEAVMDPQFIDNNLFVEFADQPGRQVVNSPLELRDFPKRAPIAAPELGQHTIEVLRDLGYDEQRISGLIESKVVSSS
jgi:crotonobetainyl-CoA:carnitine CoA-transferase CaiB-like acyl-CoA transferase